MSIVRNSCRQKTNRNARNVNAWRFGHGSVGSCTYNFVHFDRREIRTRWDINSIVLPCFPCAQTNMWCILINQTLNVNVEQKNMPTTDACVRVFHTTIFGELKQRIAYWHVQIRREYFFRIIFFFRQSDWIRCSCKRTKKKVMPSVDPTQYILN